MSTPARLVAATPAVFVAAGSGAGLAPLWWTGDGFRPDEGREPPS